MKKLVLNESGKQKVDFFLRNLVAKRKEILDAGNDTAYDTPIINADDIVNDAEYGVGFDEDGDYYNSWGCTDHYDSDDSICLNRTEDFEEIDVAV